MSQVREAGLIGSERTAEHSNAFTGFRLYLRWLVRPYWNSALTELHQFAPHAWRTFAQQLHTLRQFLDNTPLFGSLPDSRRRIDARDPRQKDAVALSKYYAIIVRTMELLHLFEEVCRGGGGNVVCMMYM